MIKTYEIGGRVFEQKRLGILPAAQLAKLLRESEITLSAGDPVGLFAEIAPILPEACAIVLNERGVNPDEKDISALASEFRYHLPIDTAVQVVADFFVLTPVRSIAETISMISVGGESQSAKPNETKLKRQKK